MGQVQPAVGVVYWQANDGVSTLISEELNQLGNQTVPCEPAAPLPRGLAAVLVHGPHGSLQPLARALLALPRAERPALVLWHTEQFWNPATPTFLATAASDLRAGLDRLLYLLGRRAGDPRWGWLLGRAHRFRYYGDLRWLHRAGLLTVLAVPSRWVTQFLVQRGLPAVCVYWGTHPAWGADLGLERDIDVLWLGKVGSARRAAVLDRVRRDLARHGLTLHRVDGVEHPYAFGQARTELLNRTKIVLNVLRQPWDSNYMRLCLAASNRAMVVTEPTLPHAPFETGVHLAEAPVSRLAATIAHYLDCPPERQRLVEAMHRFATTELTVRQSVARLVRLALPHAPRVLA